VILRNTNPIAFRFFILGALMFASAHCALRLILGIDHYVAFITSMPNWADALGCTTIWASTVMCALFTFFEPSTHDKKEP